MVRPHEIPVGVEEQPNMAVAEGQPDGQHGRLQARPQAVVGRRLLVLVPNEQAEVVPALDTAPLFALGRKEGRKVGGRLLLFIENTEAVLLSDDDGEVQRVSNIV